jgi:hypothetical protein
MNNRHNLCKLQIMVRGTWWMLRTSGTIGVPDQYSLF